MTRLRNIVLNTATAISVLLCVTALALWIRGEWVEDYASRGTPEGSAAVVFLADGSARAESQALRRNAHDTHPRNERSEQGDEPPGDPDAD